MHIQGLTIGTGTIDSSDFLLALHRLDVNIGFAELLTKSLRIQCQLDGLTLRHVVSGAEPPPPTEIPKPFPEMLRSVLDQVRLAFQPIKLPLEVHAEIDARAVTIRLLRPDNASVLDIRDLTLHCSVPSLKAGSLTLQLGFQPYLNAHALTPVSVQADVQQLCSAQGYLQPLKAQANCTATAEGLDAMLTVTPKAGLKADFRVNMGQFLPPLRAFLPQTLPNTQGLLALSATAKATTNNTVALALVLFADNLSATGGSLQRKSLKPLSFSLLQEAHIDLGSNEVKLPGTLVLFGKQTLKWNAQLTGLRENHPELRLDMGPATLDLQPVLACLPDALPVGVSFGAAVLQLGDLHVQASFEPQRNAMPTLQSQLDQLSLTLRNISQTQGKQSLTVANAEIGLNDLTLSLPAGEKGQASAHIHGSASGVRKTGASPLTLRTLTLPDLSLKLEESQLSPDTLFGLVGKLTLATECTLLDLNIPGQLQAAEVTQHTKISATLPRQKQLTASLDQFALDIPRLTATPKNKKPFQVPVTIRAAAPEVHLVQRQTLEPEIKGATVLLSMGSALQAKALLSTSQGGRQVTSNGSATMNAGQLASIASPLLPRDAKMSGNLNVEWQGTGMLPPPGGTAATPTSLRAQVAALRSIEELTLTLNTQNVSVDWPRPKGPRGQDNSLHLRGLTTPKPLRFSTTHGAETSSVNGSLAFGPLASLPGLGALEKPISGMLTFTAAQQGVRSLQLSEILRIDGLGLEQTLNVTADKLDALLDAPGDLFSALLEHADGVSSFSLKTNMESVPSRAVASVSGKGRMEMGGEARLVGGRSLAVSGRFLSPGMDIKLGPDVSLTGLQGNLAIQRAYTLGFGPQCGAAASALAAKPLSERVFDQIPSAQEISPNAASFTLRSLHGLQQSRGQGSFGFSTLQLKSGPLPLALNDMSVSLDTSGPLPALRSFRLGLFGGNVLGSAAVHGVPGRYVLDADCAFTGINAAQMLPGRGAKDLGDQAEASGRVTMRFPITPDAEVLLRQLRLRADITKVGPRTLERMLYALDPEELNETIVQQRRLMGMGYPRNLRLNVDYGNLSLTGQVEVKGFRLDLPQIDRLGIANLPIRKDLAPALAKMTQLSAVLDLLSTTQLCRQHSVPVEIKPKQRNAR